MQKQDYNLDIEEQEVLEFIESGKGKRVKNFEKMKENLAISAREHIKRKPVTIRLQTPLLNRIRSEASRKGIPYQTYIQSVLFEYLEKEAMTK